MKKLLTKFLAEIPEKVLKEYQKIYVKEFLKKNKGEISRFLVQIFRDIIRIISGGVSDLIPGKLLNESKQEYL